MNEDKPVARGDMRTPAERERAGDVARDPLGTHPIGTAVGGVAGAVAAGAAVGTVAGPIGTAVGAVVGALAGGMTGKAVADMVDPRAEDEYWRQNWNTRDYVDNQYSYDQDYSSAYRYGVDAYTNIPAATTTRSKATCPPAGTVRAASPASTGAMHATPRAMRGSASAIPWSAPPPVIRTATANKLEPAT